MIEGLTGGRSGSKMADKLPNNLLHEDDLENFITYLNDNSGDGMQPKLGLEIEFMERNEFDSALLLPFLSDMINDCWSPLRGGDFESGKIADGPNISASRVKEIAFQIKNYFRKKFLLPVLSNCEIINWAEDPVPRKNDKLIKDNPEL